MPRLNNKGPENLGPATGRELGLCSNNDLNKISISEFGRGMGLKYHSGGGIGKGKRLKYIQLKNFKKDENSSSSNTNK